jgi:hypothetical protein
MVYETRLCAISSNQYTLYLWAYFNIVILVIFSEYQNFPLRFLQLKITRTSFLPHMSFMFLLLKNYLFNHAKTYR